ncbi:MAG: GNAT family N-acetyltransferase [Bacteroidota bacterium]
MSKIIISTDKLKLDIPYIHSFLSTSYWAKGRTIEQVETSIEHSICFGVYLADRQIGFARVLTDYVVFAYLMDVFIDPVYRGKGYAKLLLQQILQHPDFEALNQWHLKTKDAHSFYEQLGFQAIENKEWWMVLKNKGICNK